MKSRYDAVIREAEKESEVMKQKKLLEVKEKFLHLKADLEKQVSARNSKIQSVEAKLKQRELNLNQRQEDLQRKNSEFSIAVSVATRWMDWITIFFASLLAVIFASSMISLM